MLQTIMATKHILVVDDDVELLKALRKVLSKDEYDVATASSAVEAMAQMGGDSRFDLVITDLSMPGESGISLLKKIRQQSPQTRVVMLTAFGDWSNYGEAMALGASEFLSKPINTEELLQCVHRTLEDAS
jgi:DNA-binding NtrC family response regulator